MSGFVTRWADRKQQRELEAFLEHLRVMDGGELGFVMAIATHQRHNIEKALGYQLCYPIAVWKIDSRCVITLVRQVKLLQSEKKLHLASGLMIWAHTLRAMSPVSSPKLRSLGRDMWHELARGFHFVVLGRLQILDMFGDDLRIEGFDQLPDGLQPLA